MKKFVSDFFLRGLMAAAGGPVVLAIVYAILGVTGTITTMTAAQVSMGILTVTLLALVAGGMTAIYQVEQLPLLSAILIHGGSLYAAYLLIYLINGWLKHQLLPILVFTVVFVLGYALIWTGVYLCTKKKADSINKKLNAR